MKKITLIIALAAMFFAGAQAMAQDGKGVCQFSVKDENGEDVSLQQYEGKVLLIVNTATRCGFTPQYEELEALYRDYKDKGFVILDFPCNQFGGQAPGSYEEIHAFCTDNYNITFPQFDKVEVNGGNAAPLFTWLKSRKGFQALTRTTASARSSMPVSRSRILTTKRIRTSSGTSPSSSSTGRAMSWSVSNPRPKLPTSKPA